MNSTHIYRLKQKDEQNYTIKKNDMAVKWPQWNARFTLIKTNIYTYLTVEETTYMEYSMHKTL
jgi:hypothetical protein